MSEQQRTEGFRRYLPEFGWRSVVLVKQCNCAERGSDSETETIDPDPGTMFTARDLARIRDLLASGSISGPVIRIACSPRLCYRLWLSLASVAGHGLRSESESAEVFHLVHPRPSHSAGQRPGLTGRALLVLAKATGRLLGRIHEQDRIDWVDRGSCMGERLVRELGIHAVVGSFPGVQNLEIAARIARKTGIPWIADCRDSVAGGYCCSMDMAPRVGRTLRTAARVIHSSSGYAAQDKNVGLFGGDACIIENGFIEEDLCRATDQQELSCRTFTVRFLGTVYPGRNLDVFMLGFRRFLSKHGVNDTVFEYYGCSEKEVACVVRAEGASENCRIMGPVAHDKALALTASATVLVLPTNTVGHTGVPGAKFYEYLGCRRPILAAGGRDQYVDSVLARTGMGRACISADEVASTLTDWYTQWRDTGKISLPSEDREIMRFSRRTGAHRLAELLDEVSGQQ